MLEWCVRGVRVRISVWFPAIVIVMLSCDSTGMAALSLSAAVLHELGHCTAMWWYHDTPERITFGIFGIRVERRQQYTVGYRALGGIALAGPLANVCWCVVTAAFGWYNAAVIHAVCGGLQLLPIVSLDGGEALYAFLCRYTTEHRAERWVFLSSVVTVFPLSVLGFFVLMADGYNVTLLVLCGYLILRMFLRVGH